MRRWLSALLILSIVCPAWPETESPPYEVSDPSINENFREVYYTLDKLSLRPNGNAICFDGTTFCVNLTTHRVGVRTANPSQAFTIYNETANTGVAALISNFATGTGSNAGLVLQTSIGTGDPYINFNVSGGSNWALGIDNSDAYKFKLSNNDAVGTNDRVVVTEAGLVGIGTSNPVSKIHMSSGTLLLDGTSPTIKLAGNSIVATAAANTYTVPDAGGNAGFVMTESDQTINGTKSFTSSLKTTGSVNTWFDVGTQNTNTGTSAAARAYAANANSGANIIMYGANHSATYDGGGMALKNIARFTGDSGGSGVLLDAPVGDLTLGGGGFKRLRYNSVTGNIETYGNTIPASDNGYSSGADGRRWTAVWAANGTIQTSAAKLKKNIREITFTNGTSSLVTLSTVTLPASVKLETKPDKEGKSQQSVVTTGPQSYDVPRGIVFQWANSTGPYVNADVVGFVGDDLPIEAHALRDDGTRDPENFYAGAVVGILCAKVRDMDARLKQLESDVKALKAVKP